MIIDEPKLILGRYGKAVCLCDSVYTGSESIHVHVQTTYNYSIEAHGTIITCACMLTMLNTDQGKQDGRKRVDKTKYGIVFVDNKPDPHYMEGIPPISCMLRILNTEQDGREHEDQIWYGVCTNTCTCLAHTTRREFPHISLFTHTSTGGMNCIVHRCK